MKKLFYVMMLGAVLGLLVPSCQKEPNSVQAPLSDQSGAIILAKAATYTYDESYTIDMYGYVPCAAGGAGEDVYFSGYLHELYHYTINDNNFTIKVHYQPQGLTGVGMTTGDVYHATGVTQETYGGSFVNGQYSDTYVNNYLLIGPGKDNNLLVHETWHITFNANGELTAYIDNYSYECK